MQHVSIKSENKMFCVPRSLEFDLLRKFKVPECQKTALSIGGYVIHSDIGQFNEQEINLPIQSLFLHQVVFISGGERIQIELWFDNMKEGLTYHTLPHELFGGATIINGFYFPPTSILTSQNEGSGLYKFAKRTRLGIQAVDLVQALKFFGVDNASYTDDNVQRVFDIMTDKGYHDLAVSTVQDFVGDEWVTVVNGGARVFVFDPFRGAATYLNNVVCANQDAIVSVSRDPFTNTHEKLPTLNTGNYYIQIVFSGRAPTSIERIKLSLEFIHLKHAPN
jgi:hypothetical protein